MAEVILDVRDLHKSYRSNEAVRGISFHISKGEIFGLLGPNGAGKTTTISMVSGLTLPTSGHIFIEGMELEANTNKVKARVGLVPQELALYPTLSARENLVFFGQIYRLHGKHLMQRVDAVLEMVQLVDRANEPVKTFSGGMKRRINIAAGLLHEPDLLFLDEPTVGVDPQSRNAIFESVLALNQAGLTIVYITHYMEEAQRLCHRVAIIDQGQVIAMDTPANLVRFVGEGIIRISIADGLIETVKRQAEQLPMVGSIAIQDHQLDIRAKRSQEALTKILDITNRLDAHVTSLQIFEPNLETVFLSLTGKNLRD